MTAELIDGQLDLLELLATNPEDLTPKTPALFYVGHPGRNDRGHAIYPMVTWGCGICGTANTDRSLQHGDDGHGTFRSVNYSICRPCAEAHCETPAQPGCIGRAIHDGRLSLATNPDHKLQPARWQGCLLPGPMRPGEQWWTGWDHAHAAPFDPARSTTSTRAALAEDDPISYFIPHPNPAQEG